MKRKNSTIKRAEKVFTPALHMYYPITVASAKGTHVFTSSGQKYLDFTSGLAVLNIGHNHPRVLEAVRGQLLHLVHTGGIYYNETTVTAAERLVSTTPAGLDMIFFSNSGAEAVEGALKLARHVTGRQGIISFTGAFHGRTLGAVSVTTSSARYRKNYHPLLPSVFQSPYPYCFRCAFRRKPGDCELQCLEYLKDLVERVITPEEVAAVIIEPVLGEGGYFPAPEKFLAGLRELCSAHGILMIADEVQSGVGRTGKWFAVEQSGVVPDIMTVAKGIASGFPLSAVVSTPHLMNKWPPGAHGTTFGGNPVSCAASTATIEAIREEGLLEKSSVTGAAALTRLTEFGDGHPFIGSVRGYGYMIGIEFVKENGEPDGEACTKVLDYCLGKGLILIGCGLERNVVRFIPPLNASANEIEEAIDIVEAGARNLL
ncbi:MAG TPA: aspartate aminotransferase family protein [Geobacteraceae bacterium]|nr:aspartate aminotransferase family protein [Geobacteraceae bacterium]